VAVNCNHCDWRRPLVVLLVDALVKQSVMQQSNHEKKCGSKHLHEIVPLQFMAWCKFSLYRRNGNFNTIIYLSHKRRKIDYHSDLLTV
jgi:hypothetical protein